MQKVISKTDNFRVSIMERHRDITTNPMPDSTERRSGLNEPLIPRTGATSRPHKPKLSAARKRWMKVKKIIPMITGLRKLVNTKLNRPTPQRFTQALKGPDLEDLDESESIAFDAEAQWPFLLRFPVNTFGICIGLSSQVALWKNLASQSSVAWANVPSIISVVLWCITFIVFYSILITYLIKSYFWIGAIKREWDHPVRINFFFAPCITASNLCLTVPAFITSSVPTFVFVIVAIPLIILDILVFGEWFSGRDRLLCHVANPTTNLSVCTNFVCANLAAITGWNEAALVFFSIGMGHYIAVFVSLYQQLPTSEKVPENMHPAYFMFVSPPCAAALAWSNISGSFDTFAKSLLFLAIFLYMCLVARLHHYLQIRFTLSWWAYCFPISLAASAVINYANTITNILTQALAFGLSLVAVLIVLSVTIVTSHRFFTWKLFPNDVVVFIKDKKEDKDLKGDNDDKEEDDDDDDDIGGGNSTKMEDNEDVEVTMGELSELKSFRYD